MTLCKNDHRRSAYGRAAALGVFIALLIVLLLAFALYVANDMTRPPTGEGEHGLSEATAYAKRLTLVLSLVLMSGLLLIVFLVATYFLLRAGRIARAPIGGHPTTYVDAWKQYRVTDEQIAAATEEPERDPGRERRRRDEPDDTDDDRPDPDADEGS